MKIDAFFVKTSKDTRNFYQGHVVFESFSVAFYCIPTR